VCENHFEGSCFKEDIQVSIIYQYLNWKKKNFQRNQRQDNFHFVCTR
jgi:hypothetical protein